MKEDCIALMVGGQMNIHYMDYDNTDNFLEGADDKERVKGVMESFV